MLVMDGQEIINIINNVSSLSNAFGRILASDDVQRILVDVSTNANGFLQWAKSIFLQHTNGVRTFPIGFILNMGTHQNGGKHWQSIYFDNEGILISLILNLKIPISHVLRQRFSKDLKS